MGATIRRGDICDYDFHPPGDLRLFRQDASGVLRLDDEAVAYQAAYGDVVLRHYAFRDQWFKVNYTVARDGSAVEEASAPETPAFAFNCDLATPMVRGGASVYAVDLELDVLVRADARSYEVVDEANFARSRDAGWIIAREASGARRGLAELIEIVQAGKLIEFLNGFCSIGPSAPPTSLPVKRLDRSVAPTLLPPRGPTWSRRRMCCRLTDNAPSERVRCVRQSASSTPRRPTWTWGAAAGSGERRQVSPASTTARR